MSHVNSKNVLTSLFWKYMETGGVKGVAFLVSVILARLLSPDEYGIIVLITVFINVSNILVQSGFNTALIQRNDVTEIDYSTVFFISEFIAFFIYLLLFISAPHIANFYNQNTLSNILRCLSLVIFFNAFNSIQIANYVKQMNFKYLFKKNFTSSIISGILGILSALLGFGAWSLVVQQLSNSILICILMLISKNSWRPTKNFSIKRGRILFSYGWKITFSSLIDTLYNELSNLIIGKIFSSSSLAYYNKGQEFPKFLVTNIDSSIESVMLPTYSSAKDNLVKLKEYVRIVIKSSSYVVFPFLFGLAACAPSIVFILLGEAWMSSVIFVQIYCAGFFFHPINIANLQAINGMGRSDITLKINIIKKILAFIILILSIKYGIIAIAFSSVINGIIFVALNVFPNRKLLNYGIKEQFKDIFPNFILSLIMGLCVYQFNLLQISHILLLIIQVTFGIIIYLTTSILSKNTTFFYLLDKIKLFFRTK